MNLSSLEDSNFSFLSILKRKADSTLRWQQAEKVSPTVNLYTSSNRGVLHTGEWQINTTTFVYLPELCERLCLYTTYTFPEELYFYWFCFPLSLLNTSKGIWHSSLCCSKLKWRVSSLPVHWREICLFQHQKMECSWKHWRMIRTSNAFTCYLWCR